MGDKSNGKPLDSQVQKQRDVLKKAGSVVQRPPAPTTPFQSQNVTTNSSDSSKFITYPEFAPLQQGSRSLLSLRRLFVVLYLSIGTTATVYVVSKVHPFLNLD